MDFISNNPIKSVIGMIVLYNVLFGTIKLRYGHDNGIMRSHKLRLSSVVTRSSPFYSTYVIDKINNTKTYVSYDITDKFLHNIIRFQPIVNKDITISNIA